MIIGKGIKMARRARGWCGARVGFSSVDRARIHRAQRRRDRRALGDAGASDGFDCWTSPVFNDRNFYW